VRWTREPLDGKDLLRLSWEESGLDQPVTGPERQGFGLELLQRTLPYDLRADTEVEFRREGLRFRMAMPLGPGVLAD
jgi:two-component system CheB/CheR fusion protein